MKHILITTIAAVVLVGCGNPDISLLEAAKNGDVEAAKKALADDADVDTKGELGMTPLYWAAIEGHKEIVELLIAEGANVNAKDLIGNTPLHIPVIAEIPKMLVAAGADVNAINFFGNAPLHECLWNMKLAELLIFNGADVNIRNSDGKTPLDKATVNPNDVAILLKELHTDQSESYLLNAYKEIADLLRKHGGKTGEELKTEGK